MKKPLAFALAIATLILSGAANARTRACGELQGLRVAPATIGLPTKGAVVVSARAAPAGGYCLVGGKILSVDPTAQDIQF